jgi:hypothetical protein
MSKSKKHSKTRKLLLIAFVIVFFLISLLAAYYILYIPNQIKNGSQKVSLGEPVKGGPGGDVQSLNTYYKEALAAFKAGDKQKAKLLAGKGLDENSQLTLEQRQQVIGQSEVIINLERIQRGKEPMQ